MLSRVPLFVTLRTVVSRLLCPWILQARTLEWVAMSSSRGSSQTRDRTCISCISCIGRQILYQLGHQRSPLLWVTVCNSLPRWKYEEWETSVSKPQPPADLMLYFAPCFANLRVSLLIFTWKCHMQLKCPKRNLTSHPSTCSFSYNSSLRNDFNVEPRARGSLWGLSSFLFLCTCSLMDSSF